MRLEAAVIRYFEDRRLHVDLALKKLGSPREKIVRLQKRLQLADSRLSSSARTLFDKLGGRLRERAGRLDAMSPLRVVERGYSILEKEKGVKTQIITRAEDVAVGENLKVRLAVGTLNVEVKSRTLKN